MDRLGIVSFLNSKPLIAGLEQDRSLQLRFDVPAQLPNLLAAGEVDVALVPIIDVLRATQPWQIVSDACIGCVGETMTVRVFSQVPPERITQLQIDGDSHTSVALATILWQELYAQPLELLPLGDLTKDQPEAVLLIGDKVVDPARASFAYEVDLGGAWLDLTQLPFVFAVWASLSTQSGIGDKLSAARDAGLGQLQAIAAEYGPPHGWSIKLAEQYLNECLRFKLDDRMLAGAERFAELARKYELAPADSSLSWPDKLKPEQQETPLRATP